MFHNFSLLCVTKVLNRLNGYPSLVKKEKNGIIIGYSISRCTDHATKSGESFLKTELSEAHGNVHNALHINEKQEKHNPYVYNNSLKILHGLYSKNNTVKIDKQKTANALKDASDEIIKNVNDILNKGDVLSKKSKSTTYISVYLEKLTSPNGEAIAAENEEEKNETTSSKQGIIYSVKRHIKIYCELSKWKLTLWVTLSSCFGQFMLGYPSVMGFSTLLIGVFLCSCSANTFNQIFERSLDKLMKRTRKRPLPNNKITTKHAKIYGLTTALIGTLTLWHYNNLLTATLGVFNIILYTCIYTPLKLRTPYNTHVGSIVGSIPTLMGCTSVIPTLFLPEPWILFVTQLLWQFPHFYSLAYLYKEDYLKGNYKMFPLKDSNGFYTAKLCKPYVVALVLLPFVFSLMDYTSYMYVLSTLLPNMFIYYKFHKFAKIPCRGNVRSFFKHSLWHIILLLALSAYHAKFSSMKEQMPKQTVNDKGKETNTYERMYDQKIAKLKKTLLKYAVVFL